MLVYYFLLNQKGDLSAVQYTQLVCKNGVRLNIVECCCVPASLCCLFQGGAAARAGRQSERAREIWGVCEAPLQIGAGSADQSRAFREGCCDTLKSWSHLQHSLHQVH